MLYLIVYDQHGTPADGFVTQLSARDPFAVAWHALLAREWVL